MPSNVAEDDDADLADVEVQRDAEGAVLELEQLVGHRRGQALDVGDTVTGLGDDADLLAGDLRRVGRDVALQRATDVVRGDGQLGHPLLPYGLGLGSPVRERTWVTSASGERVPRVGEPAERRAVVEVAADQDADATEDRRVDGDLQR